MKFKNIVLVVIGSLFLVNPLIVSAKLQEYKIVIGEKEEIFEEKNNEINDITRSSDNVRSVFNIDNSIDGVVTILVIFASFAVTSSLIYNFILKEQV